MLGLLLSSGALVGDMVESFFKRRANVKPGKPFIPWDQLDYVVGALLFVYFIYPLTIAKIIIILLISVFGHILFSHLGYYLKLKKVKW